MLLRFNTKLAKIRNPKEQILTEDDTHSLQLKFIGSTLTQVKQNMLSSDPSLCVFVLRSYHFINLRCMFVSISAKTNRSFF